MGSELLRRLRLPAIVATIAGTCCAVPLGSAASNAAPAPLSISIVGNHFVNGAGHRIRLLGVDRTSAEYGCVDGFGYDDGHFDNADAAAIASWDADAVRIPLNEDCWLGINGQPNSDEGADPPLTMTGYRQEIEQYVQDLNAHGTYAILDLHWTAPGIQVPLEQQPMPDADHSPAFWTSVASTFKANPAVVFDLFNEPYDPTDPRSGDDTDPDDAVSWNCWETGTENGPTGGSPCFTQAYDDQGQPTSRYQIAGLQTLLSAVRATGATQPVMAGGLDYANDLGDSDHGQQWMDHAPDDPLDQEAASFHNYMGKECDNSSCWNAAIKPIAAHVPVVTGEFDEDDFDEANCHERSSTFDATYMKWADAAGVSYLAWGWIVETKAEQDQDGCSAFTLIDDYTHYTPAPPNGVALYDHLHALATATAPPVKLTGFHAAVRRGGKRIAVRLRAAQRCAGMVTAKTVHSYATTGTKRHKVSLGSTHVTLTKNKRRTVVLRPAASARRLLRRKHPLKTLVTITLTSPGHRRTVIHRTVSLTAKR